MVGTNATLFQLESATERAVVQQLLKQRENHARLQNYDYSHVFRKKTNCEMLRLTAIAMAIEFAYAAETSFGTPLLLQNGIKHHFMTMAWAISPSIGFFLSPLLGSLSDRCKFGWGRRRPIMTILSIGIVCGLCLLPFGKDIGHWFDSRNEHINNITITTTTNNTNNHVDNNVETQAQKLKIGAIFTIIGMVLLDLGADTLQTPARTYMLDMCTPSEQSRGLTAFTLLAGIGGTIGYALGGVDWNTMAIGTFFGGNIPTVFMLVVLIFILCYFITITTFREIPLNLIEHDIKLRPLSSESIKVEINRQQQLKNNNEQTETNYAALDADTANDISYLQKPTSLAQYLKSIFIMPPSMRILAFTNLLCWMAHLTYCLYFTDFVGEAVFNGNPDAEANSEKILLYESGVRFGCFGLSIYAISCSVYSTLVNKLLKHFGTKWVFIASISYHALGMFVLAIWPTKWGVLLFSNSAGVLYGTIFTIPYILVASYHAKDCFRIRDGESVPLKHARGLGTDVAIISSMVFVAQLIVSLSLGPLITYFNTTYYLYLSSIFGFAAAFSAFFVFYI